MLYNKISLCQPFTELNNQYFDLKLKTTYDIKLFHHWSHMQDNHWQCIFASVWGKENTFRHFSAD